MTLKTKTATTPETPTTDGIVSAINERIDTPIMIPRIDMREMELLVVGDESLICHRWSEKAKKEMLDKQMKKAKTAKEAKDPWRDYVESLYWLSKRPDNPTEDDIKAGTFGFPSVAFKSCAVSAVRDVDGLKMTEARGRFHVVGEFVEIVADPPQASPYARSVSNGEPEEKQPAPGRGPVTRRDMAWPSMREDMVRVGMGTADIRFRGEFKYWHALLRIQFNASAISPEQITNLFNLGGFGVGVGEWRPEKNGSFGRFHVATQADMERLSA